MRTAVLLLAISLPVGAQNDEGPDFRSEIRPLLSRNCFSCHGPDESARKAGLRLDDRASAVHVTKDGIAAIVPGHPSKSELMRRITDHDPDNRMPPEESGYSLADSEIEKLRRWIQGGAVYSRHWSFEKPRLSQVEGDLSAAIDRLVRNRLAELSLEPGPEADRHAILRRVSLDLTGLPPTLEEIDAFINDRAEGAYERVVDRLLSSPTYGERWASVWLDLARYADSSGYASDLPRTIFRYRDWVIQAFNGNLPYDEFTRLQLAGDLLPGATLDQKLATAFHRNTMTNSEGGTDDEEFRFEAVMDRAETTLQVWMGLTLKCARCHSHKFDPITQKEYYGLLDVFNQSVDADRQDEQPVLATPTAVQVRRRTELDGRIGELHAKVMEDATGNARAFWQRATQQDSTWTTFQPSELLSPGGLKLSRAPDGVITAAGTAPQKGTYTLTGESGLETITALRIDALSDPSLPGNGPGLTAGNGNFVLTEARLKVIPRAGADPARGRYIRLSLEGKGRILSLAEVEVFAGGTNVAPLGVARQSSTAYNGPPHLAIDGNTNGDYTAMSVTHTNTEKDPFWELDLKGEHAVDVLRIHNRAGSVFSRLNGCVIEILDHRKALVWRGRMRTAPDGFSEYKPGREPVEVPLKDASATFSQAQYAVTLATDGDVAGKPGWAVQPQAGRSHQAVFRTAWPVDVGGGQLSVELHQNWGSQHLLGKLKVHFSDANEGLFAVPVTIQTALGKAHGDRGEGERRELADFRMRYDPRLAGLRGEMDGLRKQLNGIKPVTTPVMQERAPGQRRKTHVLLRGNFLMKKEEVTAGTPRSLHPTAHDAGSPLNRLGLAQWITSPENPLTARVAVNRFWARLFGVGLVRSEENFGSQGEFPSHPRLLDHLAVVFRESGWDIKGLLKDMVMSGTYRQSSDLSEEKSRKDPGNRWLSRGPRFRLPAEMVRDQALAVSGLLSRKMLGPSVFPPQPAGLWQAAFDSRRWQPSMGEDAHRRALYTFIRRTIPYPSMTCFDAPNREYCLSRRIGTNTPLQALVTLNDPVFHECAQAFARRLLGEGELNVEERIRRGFLMATQREPSAFEVDTLSGLFSRSSRRFATRKTEALAFATEPLGPLAKGVDEVVAAAWTVVAGVLLNLDAVLTRG